MQSCSTRPSRFNAVARIATAIAIAVGAGVLGARPLAASGEKPLAASGEKSFAVIVSKNVAVDELSIDELRRILTFKRTLWKTGQPINLLLPGGSSPVRSFVLNKLYRMTDDELHRYILQRIFQAEIDYAPKVVAAEQDAVAFVTSGKSVVAIVSADTPGLGAVKILRIDGRLPGEAKYALQ